MVSDASSASHQKEEVCENGISRSRSSSILAVSQKLSDMSISCALSARHEEGAGILAISCRPIEKGELLLQCHAASISLDPHHRTSRCSFCAVSFEAKSNAIAKTTSQQEEGNKEARFCNECRMVATCKSCALAMQWHTESCECQVMQALAQCFHETLGIEQVDSIYVLTVRLIIRRWYDVQKQQEETSKDINNNFLEEEEEVVIVEEEGGTKNDSNMDETCTKSNYHTKSLLSHFYLTPIDWDLFDLLYKQDTATMGLSEIVTIICNGMKKLLSKTTETTTKIQNDNVKKQRKDAPSVSTSSPSLEKLFTKERFESVLGRVLGCCHAITDLNLPLGCQSVGRALFLHHSYYNHSCCPNSFLSCHIGEDSLSTPSVIGSSMTNSSSTPPRNTEETAKSNKQVQQGQQICGLVAQVYSISNVGENTPITISYIPMSGIDCKERRQRLQDGYCFECNCEACLGATKQKKLTRSDEVYGELENALQTPEGTDLQSLREVQFNCNERLLRIKEEDDKSQVRSSVVPPTTKDDFNRDDCLNSCLMMIRMSQRGIQNQKIPISHEVSIEAHRLLAMALSLQWNSNSNNGDDDSVMVAIQEHCNFFDKVQPIQRLFDPIAKATQHLECFRDYKRCGNKVKQTDHLKLALEIAQISVGRNHPFYTRMIQEQSNITILEKTANEEGEQPVRKKLKK